MHSYKTSIKENDEQKIRAWIGVPARLEAKLFPATKYTGGKVLYGVREPIAPATDPFYECEIGSKKKVFGCDPAYWFVSDQHKGLKVHLKKIRLVDNETIFAKARDAGETFNVTIRLLK